MGWLLSITLEAPSDRDNGSTQSGKLCCHLDQGEGLVAAGAVKGGVHRAFPVQEGVPLGECSAE